MNSLHQLIYLRKIFLNGTTKQERANWPYISVRKHTAFGFLIWKVNHKTSSSRNSKKVSKSKTLITFSLLSKVPMVNCNGARVVHSWLRLLKMVSNYMVVKNSRSYLFSLTRLLNKSNFPLAKTTSYLTMGQLLMLQMRIISSSGN